MSRERSLEVQTCAARKFSTEPPRSQTTDLYLKYSKLMTWRSIQRGTSEAIDELLKVQNRARLLAAIVLLTAMGTTYVMFSDTILSFFGRETAEVARQVLKNEGLQDQTLELANAAVQSVLRDPEVRARALAFLRETASSEETRRAMVRLSVQVLKDPLVLEDAAALGKEVWLNLIRDPDTMDELVSVLKQALLHAQTQTAVIELIGRLCQDETVQGSVQALFHRLFLEADIQEALNEMMINSSHAVLDDASIARESRRFVSEVVSDAEVQRTGGQALWQSVVYSVEPTTRKVLGFALFVLLAQYTLTTQ
eukprot:CAMPEP_0185756428 /NCGR_PEP_ID=MMETSP1174-20130828/14862_1 /TAXON_ID=35687 /ORGANISM="Dictyocha speculum, Strain CCMP1381" /LENGTH=309 /DNA_ID=CAMNT_0028435391 /DNA_START=286 /DNA_END=1215 /DNA_ORIENTATION=+